MINTPLIKQIISFVGVGAISTVLHYLVLLFWVEGLHLETLFGVALGSLAGAISNYLLNYKYTFQSDKEHTEALPKFFLVATIGLLLNLLLVKIMIENMALFYLFAQLIATFIVLIYNFIINKYWTFHVS